MFRTLTDCCEATRTLTRSTSTCTLHSCVYCMSRLIREERNYERAISSYFWFCVCDCSQKRLCRGSPTESPWLPSKNANLAHNIVVGRAVGAGLSPSTTEGSRPGQPYYIKATTGSLESLPSP